MTTIVASRKHRAIAADSFNTDASGMARLVNKIELLDNGAYFLGSGHLKSISVVKQSVISGEDADWDFFTDGDVDDLAFSCVVVSPDMSRIMVIDEELTWYEVLDEYVSIGSGSSYAIGALDAGATPEEAIKIAINRDGNSGEPVQVVYL